LTRRISATLGSPEDGVGLAVVEACRRKPRRFTCFTECSNWKHPNEINESSTKFNSPFSSTPSAAIALKRTEVLLAGRTGLNNGS
jgi:hypothetical protein